MARHRSPWMDDDLTALADLARRFFNKECAPHEDRWARQHHIDRDTWTKAGSVGLLCLSIPEEYGGGGGSFAHEAVATTEQMRALTPSMANGVHSTIVAHYVYAYGTEEQRRAWLPKLATGEWVGAIAMTEPGTGSDLQSIRTRGVRDGDEYVVRGAKTFITNGFLADLVLVVARTSTEGPGSQSISIIAVETDREGFRRGRNLEKIGQHGTDTCELFFDDVRVPVTNLLGGVEGRGFIQLMQQLPQERLILAVTAAAIIEKIVELTVDYTKQREAFGKRLFDFQNTQFVLAECDTTKTIGWAFLDDCVAKHLRGELDAATAAKAKWWLTDQQVKVADACLQFFGGYGYMTEYPISRLYVDSRVQRIYGGANEIMKVLIARSL